MLAADHVEHGLRERDLGARGHGLGRRPDLFRTGDADIRQRPVRDVLNPLDLRIAGFLHPLDLAVRFGFDGGKRCLRVCCGLRGRGGRRCAGIRPVLGVRGKVQDLVAELTGGLAGSRGNRKSAGYFLVELLY